MRHVVIVESPAKCKTIHKYLGDDYTILASFGHIRDLPSKDGSVRPEEDFAMDYEISADSHKNVKAITDAVKKADSLILATDPDREGEAISWHVLETLKAKKAISKDMKVERVTFTSITKDAVKDALKHPRGLDMDLINAQQARRALDYLVGFNISPVLWRKLPGSKSAGRVQSVALRIVCDRENEIEAFRAQEYWTVDGNFLNKENQPFKAKLTHVEGKKLGKFALPEENAARKVEQALAGKNYTVANVEKKQANRYPKPPFTTSTLQQEAARKLGFSAKKTMQTAQKLYEGIEVNGELMGLITYMRTDGMDIAPEAMHATRDMILNSYGKEYLPEAPRFYKSKQKNAQEAHEAIRPTNPKLEPFKIEKQLNDDEFKLYGLIWRRLISSQMEAAVLDQVVADIDAGGYATFRATGSTVRFQGFYKVYREGWDDAPDEDDEEGGVLPPLNQGEPVKIDKAKAEQHFTEPPPRYSEASLVKRLEELGIGRPSTYASTLSTLIDREYVRLDKKRFFPEMRGRLVTTFLESFFTRYVEYNFTADLEEELDSIADGKLEWKEALRRFWGAFSTSVAEAKEVDFMKVQEALTNGLEKMLFPEGASRECPACKTGSLGLRVGKYGPFLSCSNYPECKHIRNIGDKADGDGSSGSEEPKQLGLDPKTGEPISLRKGPYGWYVQRGEAPKEKPKKGEKGPKPARASVPKGDSVEEMTLEKALALLSLPREVGMHPDSGLVIIANIGRFGPYLLHDGKYANLKGDDDPRTIGLNRAVTLLAEAAAKKAAGGRAGGALKNLGDHPDGGKITVHDGKYGPYVKWGKVNATLPKDITPDTVTLEQALEVIAGKAGKKGGGKKKTGGKKKG